MKESINLRKTKIVLASAVILSSLSLASINKIDIVTLADSTNTTKTAVQTKSLSKTYVSIGSGVSDKSKVKDALGVQDSDEVFTTNGQQLYTYLQLPNIVDSQVQSSVRISPAEPGTGTKVNIVKFDGKNNITSITSQQYAMAATSAGIKDVIITITSPKQVDGSGALAGVYQALSKNGTNLDPRNTVAANSLLNATDTAISENATDSSYPGKLTSAVTSVSGDIAKDVISGQTPQEAVINELLNKALKKQGIEDKTSSSAKKPIVQALQLVAASPAARTNTFVNQASKTAKTLSSTAGLTMANSGDYKNAKAVDKIKGFFSGIGDWIGQTTDNIKNSFSKDKNKTKVVQNGGSKKVSSQSNNIDYSTGQSNSSELLKEFSGWNGKNDGLVFDVYNNKSTFSYKEEAEKFETNGNATSLNPVNGLQLSSFDSLGRTQQANAYITKTSMSGTQARIPIPATSVPSGWYYNAQYNQSKNAWANETGTSLSGLKSNNIKGKSGYIYNKGHMIGYQFFDNSDIKTNGGGDWKQIMSANNLVTETRQANAPVQLQYENKIAKAVQAGHSVRYQVTPVYQSTELVPRIIHLQAKSVDDDGAAINFNIGIINAQQDISIDYSTGKATLK